MVGRPGWEGLGTRLNHVHHVHQRLHVMPVYWWSGDALEMLFMSIMCPSWDFLLHSLLPGVSSSVLHHSGDTIYILLQLSTEHSYNLQLTIWSYFSAIFFTMKGAVLLAVAVLAICSCSAEAALTCTPTEDPCLCIGKYFILDINHLFNYPWVAADIWWLGCSHAGHFMCVKYKHSLGILQVAIPTDIELGLEILPRV